MAGSHLATAIQLPIIPCTKSHTHAFGLTSAPQLSLAAGWRRNETQRAHSVLPSVFCVFPYISSTAAHVLLSKADGQIGDRKNHPTAIAWECPWATGDNWSEISDQAGKNLKFTQLETVYTDLCRERPVTLPSSVQSHSDAPRPVLSSTILKYTENFFSCSLSSCPHWVSRGKLNLFLLRMCRSWGGEGNQRTRCISPLLPP